MEWIKITILQTLEEREGNNSVASKRRGELLEVGNFLSSACGMYNFCYFCAKTKEQNNFVDRKYISVPILFLILSFIILIFLNGICMTNDLFL